MTKPWLALFLMMLVALQAVTAAADAHRLHPLDSVHTELAEAHGDHCPDDPLPDDPFTDNSFTDNHCPESPSASAEPQSSQSQASPDDCQHCCHCHGSFHGLLRAYPIGIALARSGPVALPATGFSSLHPTTLFRPPKA